MTKRCKGLLAGTGLRLAKAIRLGGARVNLSLTGIGVSVGHHGIRLGIDAKGKRYVTVLGRRVRI